MRILGYLGALSEEDVGRAHGLMSPSVPVGKKGPALHSAIPHHSQQQKPFRLSLKCSGQGLGFIFSIEVGPLSKVTAHLHWPGGSSGVTLGPGYDMKDRKKLDVVRDMTAIGLSAAVAASLADGAGLTGSAAEGFADENEDLVNLPVDKQVELLRLIVPHYEHIVSRNIHVPLSQSQFDALVCFVYNPGGRFTPIAKSINDGKIQQAVSLMKTRVLTGGKTNQGLVRRRARETTLLLTGHY